MWSKAKTGGKAGFDKLWALADKLGTPVNRLSNKLGSESFWPTTLDKESDKAARILRSFCKDGFYEEETVDTGDGPKKQQKVLKKIPTEVIQNAKGLAIFTTMRTGLWVSGAGGSGVLVARLPDGSWSPPSGIMLHTAAVGFLVGVDIYDCVMVLNSAEAVDAFSKLRCTVGGEVSAVAGPIGIGGVLDSEVHKRQAPIFTYLKSRGFYAGVQLDGTIVIERTDENQRFYNRKVSVGEILGGKISYPPPETLRLAHTIKAAQGDTDVDPQLVPTDASPSDFDIVEGQTFGIPDRDDPDPYGVLALEKEGIQIKEASTKEIAARDSFQFLPSPTSPVFNLFNRESIDGAVSRRSSWRTTLTDRSVQTMDMSTQTDDLPSPTARPTSIATYRSSMAGIPENGLPTIEQKLDLTAITPISPVGMIPAAQQTEGFEIAPTVGEDKPKAVEQSVQTEMSPATETPAVDLGIGKLDSTPVVTQHKTASSKSLDRNSALEIPLPPSEADSDADDEDEGDEDDEDEAVIAEVQQVSKPRIVNASPQVISKARLVTVAPKAPPPALPPRNPRRMPQAESTSPTRQPIEPESTPPALDQIDTNSFAPTSELLGSAGPPVTASTASSVYSLEIHDEPSSTHTSESAASVSSVENHEGSKSEEQEAPIASSPEVKATKPVPPPLPPRNASSSTDIPHAMPGSFA